MVVVVVVVVRVWLMLSLRSGGGDGRRLSADCGQGMAQIVRHLEEKGVALPLDLTAVETRGEAGAPAAPHSGRKAHLDGRRAGADDEEKSFNGIERSAENRSALADRSFIKVPVCVIWGEKA